MTKRRLEVLKAVRMALEEFDLLYPNEGHCLDVLFDWLFLSDQILCVACSAELCKRISGSRTLQCSSCSKSTWFTAGTFFHKAKKVRERFAVKWLMEKGVVFNSSILKDVLEIAGSTAWEIFHEISSLLADKMKQEQFPVLSSAHFREVVSKRSNLSIAAEHPRAELDELAGPMSDDHGENNDVAGGWPSVCLKEGEDLFEEVERGKPTNESSELNSTALESISVLSEEKEESCLNQVGLAAYQDGMDQIVALLRSGSCTFGRILQETGMDYKDLCTALCLLEISEQVEKGFGDVYSLLNRRSTVTASLGEQELDLIRRFTKWVRGNFGGISLKYLQNYIAYFWYVGDRKRCSEGDLLRSLMLSVSSAVLKEHRQSPSHVEVFFGDPTTLAVG